MAEVKHNRSAISDFIVPVIAVTGHAKLRLKFWRLFEIFCGVLTAKDANEIIIQVIKTRTSKAFMSSFSKK
jgi:hypothetical protein